MKITISNDEAKQMIKERIEDNPGWRVDESKIKFECDDHGCLNVVVDMGSTPCKVRVLKPTDEAPF